MTNVEYKIIEFMESTGQIVVRFRDMQPIIIDLPIDNDGNALSGDELADYLRGFIPTWHYERLEKISIGIKNAAEIHALVEPELKPELPASIIDLEVPFVSTPNDVVSAMLDMAEVNSGDTLLDLGCGDGRIVIEAAKRGCIASGIDKDPVRVAEAITSAQSAGVSASFTEADFLTYDLSGNKIITMYLNELTIDYIGLRMAGLEQGTKIISNSFAISWMKPADIKIVGGFKIFKWVL